MRILILSDVTGYMKGGVPAETRQLITGLAARGHAVALVNDIALSGAEVAEHFPIAIPTDARLAPALQSAVAAFAPDVVHVMAMSSRGIARIAPFLQSRPWVMTSHSLPPGEQKLAGFHGNEALHYGLRYLRFFVNGLAWRWLMSSGTIPEVVVHSRHMQEMAVRYGQRRDRMSIIPLGHAALAAATAPRSSRAIGTAPRLVTVGGLAHTKGLHDMVIAVEKLRNDFPDLTYRIIGEMRDASYVSYLRALIDRLSLQGHVQIEQELSDGEKLAALQAADVYVQPSHEEGFCLSYIEAATIVPRLVGADTGAIAAISADDSGARVVPVADPAALAAQVRALLRSDLPGDLAQRRIERLDRTFAWESYLDAHEALYARLIGREKLPV